MLSDRAILKTELYIYSKPIVRSGLCSVGRLEPGPVDAEPVEAGVHGVPMVRGHLQVEQGE